MNLIRGSNMGNLVIFDIGTADFYLHQITPPPSYATSFRELKQLLDFRFGHIKSPPPQSPRELVDSEGYRLVSFSSCEKCCGFWWLLVQWV